jgi:hypothetical protein
MTLLTMHKTMTLSEGGLLQDQAKHSYCQAEEYSFVGCPYYACRNTECRYAECPFGECCNAECGYAVFAAILSTVLLHVDMIWVFYSACRYADS